MKPHFVSKRAEYRGPVQCAFFGVQLSEVGRREILLRDLDKRRREPGQGLGDQRVPGVNGEPPVEETADVVGDRAARLFEYLAALLALRESPVRDFTLHPDSRAVRTGELSGLPGLEIGSLADGAWMRASVVRLLEPLRVPDEFARFLGTSTDEPRVTPQLSEQALSFSEPPLDEFQVTGIRRALDDWIASDWRPWAEEQALRRESRGVYDTIFDLRQRLVREEAETELVWGHGILTWRSNDQVVRYPAVTTRVTIEYDPDTAALSVHPDGATRLETDFLDGLPVLNDLLRERRDEWTEEPADPWEPEELGSRLQRFVLCVSRDGLVREGTEPPSPSTDAVVTLTHVLFTRRRARLMRAFLKGLSEAIVNGSDVSAPLATVVSSEPSKIVETLGLGSEQESWATTADRILMPDSTNVEQSRIVQHLAGNIGVTVQGPPGTGKTHTIANLVAHLVSQGKRVLVTAQKEQPLKVLSEKIHEDVRDLCVSVLGKDANALSQLDQSMKAILETAVPLDKQLAKQRIDSLNGELDRLAGRIAELRRRQTTVKQAETRTVMFRGKERAPAEIGKLLSADEERLNRIPDPLDIGSTCPLAPADLERLFTLECEIEPADRLSAQEDMPVAAVLPTGDALRRTTEELSELRLRLAESEVFVEDWSGFDAARSEDLSDLSRALRQASEQRDRLNAEWLVRFTGSIRAPRTGEAWVEHARTFHTSIEAIGALRTSLASHKIRLPAAGLPTRELTDQLSRLKLRFEGGKGLGILAPKDLKLAHAGCSLNGEPPRDAADVEKLISFVELQRRRYFVVNSWNEVTKPLGAPSFDEADESPEYELGLHVSSMLLAIEWEQDTWLSLQERLRELRIEAPERADARDLVKLAMTVELGSARAAERKIQAEQDQLLESLRQGTTTRHASTLWAQLIDAFERHDWARWQLVLDESTRLARLVPSVVDLNGLYAALQPVVPVFVTRIREARADFDVDSRLLPEYWEWRQTETWLTNLINEDDPVELSRQIEDTSQQLGRVIARLCSESAWLSIATSLTDQNRAALQAWAEALRRVRGGTGRYAPVWRAKARIAMREAVTAIPVWIMPIHRVVESFEPGTQPFDVIIVDESSQCDIFSLGALTLAKKAIVVGDDKQISPQVVGTDLQVVQNLIRDHIPDIGYSELLSLEASLYDIATRSFPGVIRLREHFRCLPEIIEFSNDLCYGGAILPLREEHPDPSWRPLRAVYVETGFVEAGSKINKPEAEALVGKIVELCDDPKLREMSMGVIALLGKAQARLIESELIDRLGWAEFERRKLRCGNAYDFQGDERDLMFISLVTAPTDELGNSVRIGAFTRREYEQSINVAASRARDQQWLFHSVLPEHLSPGDYRAKLISYCTDPKRVMAPVKDLLEKCESPFERDVVRRIQARGYRMRVQHRVGRFRIDIVIEGVGKRLAVECDGEAFHTPDQWEQDNQRQEILERLDWKFVRIRGGAFYRDPEKALEPLWARLDELGIGTATALQDDEDETTDPRLGAQSPTDGTPASANGHGTFSFPAGQPSEEFFEEPLDEDYQELSPTWTPPKAEASSDPLGTPVRTSKQRVPALSDREIQDLGTLGLLGDSQSEPTSIQRQAELTSRRDDDEEAPALSLPQGRSALELTDGSEQVISFDTDDDVLEGEVVEPERKSSSDREASEAEGSEADAKHMPVRAPRRSDRHIPPALQHYDGAALEDLPIGLMPMAIGFVAQSDQQVLMDALPDRVFALLGIRSSGTDRRVLQRAAWSAVSRGFARWSDKENTSLLARSRFPEALNPEVKATLAQVREFAKGAVAIGLDHDAAVESILDVVYPYNVKAPQFLIRLVSREVNRLKA